MILSKVDVLRLAKHVGKSLDEGSFTREVIQIFWLEQEFSLTIGLTKSRFSRQKEILLSAEAKIRQSLTFNWH